MTEPRGAVYDLGYTPYDDERLGRPRAIRATVFDGVNRVLGLRRKARRKVMPWGLLVLALLPAAVFVGLAFLVPDFSPEAESPFGGLSEYFTLVGVIVLLFVSLAAPELLIPDRRQGVLDVYSSRPLLSGDYVTARAAALVTTLSLFLIVPQLMMYVGFAALDLGGFVNGLTEDPEDLLRIFAAAAVYMAAFGAPALLVATFAGRKSAATAAYLVLMLATSGVAEALQEAADLPGRRYFALAPLIDNADYVKSWIFDSAGTEAIALRAGFDPWASLLVIVGVAVVSMVVVVWRYRRLM